MKIIQWYNKVFYKVWLPIFGDKKIIYTVQGANWWAWYASDTKRWIFEKGEYKF
jgi:hypothetical protein